MSTGDEPLVYLVDDEPSVLDSVLITLKRQTSFRVRTFPSFGEAVSALEETRPDVVVTDIAMDGRDAGIDLLKKSRELWPEVPVLLMSAVGSREAAIEAVNAGAYHFLEKPFDQRELVGLLRRAVSASSARTRARRSAAAGSKHARSKRHNHPGAEQDRIAREWNRRLVGDSEAFRETVALVEQAAASDATVLLEGESGTGKGVLASYLHQCSSRSDGRYLSVNCGALPETLLESQLFGHLKGSFTGAEQDREGLLRACGAGTFFLDEVSEMSPATQVKLLRVLQEREVIPVGGTEARDVEARFVAATNRNLRQEVARGRFREDLFWRLNVFAIEVPPLRDREGDVALLAEYALDRIRARDDGVEARAISAAALEVLEAYRWPGNVRELENAIEFAAVVAPGEIRPDHLPDHVRRPVGEASGSGTEEASVPSGRVLTESRPTLAEMERAYASWVLQQEEGDWGRAAERLDVPLALLRQLIETPGT